MSADLLERARTGDGAAFEELIGPYRREMHVHCYRILGSVADAEDALQETLTAAWLGLPGFEARASIRTWLYRIATTRCLNMLRSASRRPPMELSLDVEPPEPTRLGEVVWLEPYPDVLLADRPDRMAGPEARYEAREAISLAFVTALQLLPPRQRAALILRDVLDYSAREVADLLDTTEQSVTSALKRARATMAKELPTTDRPAPPPNSAVEEELVSRLVRAFEASDVEGIVALMTEDAWVRMPPVPLEYQGKDLARRFFATVAFRQGRRYRLIPTRANGQPAFGVYVRDPLTGIARAFGIFVITLSGDRVSAVTRFDNTVLARFGLPRTIEDV
ncbi:MAG TPA: sigma-70 family RNA polymerase sigma factor [Acidimicrobiales bacterium]|nr:sigma-70 family RNA polymerase sigma factor [Acidimicrobiales bacterium]